MAFRMLFAAVAAAAVGVGLVLPAPHHGRLGFDTAPRSQIAQIEVAR